MPEAHGPGTPRRPSVGLVLFNPLVGGSAWPSSIIDPAPVSSLYPCLNGRPVIHAEPFCQTETWLRLSLVNGSLSQ